MAKKTAAAVSEAPTQNLTIIDDPMKGGQAGSLAAVPASALASQQPSAAAALFLDEAKGRRQALASIPLIRIDHQQGQFEMPTGELANEVYGFPIYLFQTRRWYEKAFSPAQPGGPPDCWSPNMEAPSASSLKVQAEQCDGCPRNVYGSARDGRGKACGTYTWVFLLNGNFGNPPLACLVAPPSSIKVLLGNTFQPGFFQRMTQRYQVYEIVWTKFALERPAEGSPHCVLAPAAAGVATDLEQVKTLAAIRNQAMEAMEAMRGATVSATMEE